MTSPEDSWSYTYEYDADDKACGDLIFDLRFFFQPLPAESRVRVTALDPSAPVDLTAWCRSTGHKLIDWHHPYYLIEKRANKPT
jgi:hypothetical protein